MKVTNCELEIDFNRGVMYVHSQRGFTSVRICGLKELVSSIAPGVNIASDDIQVDISVQESIISVTQVIGPPDGSTYTV